MNVLGTHACTRVHDKLSCIRLQNCTIAYTNMAAVTIFIANNNLKKLHQSVKQRDIWRLNAKISNNLQQINFTDVLLTLQVAMAIN